jgi:hypothetical protein
LRAEIHNLAGGPGEIALTMPWYRPEAPNLLGNTRILLAGLSHRPAGTILGSSD